jgi:hypothetical protein
MENGVLVRLWLGRGMRERICGWWRDEHDGGLLNGGRKIHFILNCG